MQLFDTRKGDGTEDQLLLEVHRGFEEEDYFYGWVRGEKGEVGE